MRLFPEDLSPLHVWADDGLGIMGLLIYLPGMECFWGSHCDGKWHRGIMELKC